MGKLRYLADVSLDLFIEDEHAIQSDLTAESAGTCAAASTGASR